MLESNLGISIKSIGNIINENTIEVLKNIDVIPSYVMYYKFFTNINDTITISNFINNHIEIESDNIEIQLNDFSKSLCFAIPENYKINYLYGKDLNNDLYNWTGAVLMNSSIYNILYKDTTTLYSKYNIYKITSYDSNGTGFKCESIIINISNISNNEYNIYDASITRQDVTNDISLLFTNESDNLCNENFNSLYWIDLGNMQKENEINNKLNNVIFNCA